MPYRLDAAQVARDNGHTLNHIGTVRAPYRFSIDKYLCDCGAEVQLTTSSFVGNWLSPLGAEPCPKVSKEAGI